MQTNKPKRARPATGTMNLARLSDAQNGDHDTVDDDQTDKRLRARRTGGPNINSARVIGDGQQRMTSSSSAEDAAALLQGFQDPRSRSQAPSPEARSPQAPAADINTMTARELRDRAIRRQQDEARRLNGKVSFGHTINHSGSKLRYVIVSARTVRTERFSVSKAEVGLRIVVAFEKYLDLSREERRDEHNNVFENFWKEERARKKKKKK